MPETAHAPHPRTTEQTSDDFSARVQSLIEEWRERFLGEESPEQMRERLLNLELEVGLEQSQRAAARFKADVMRPRLRRILFKGDEQRMDVAADTNKEMHASYFRNKVARHEAETGTPIEGDELRVMARAAALENMAKIDELAVGEYGGKESWKIVNLIRNRGRTGKGIFGAVSVLFGGGVVGTAVSGTFMSRIGRNHVGDHRSEIQGRNSDAILNLDRQAQELSGDPMADYHSMMDMASESMKQRALEEREAVGREIAPIAVGTAAGIVLNTAGNISLDAAG